MHSNDLPMLPDRKDTEIRNVGSFQISVKTLRLLTLPALLCSYKQGGAWASGIKAECDVVHISIIQFSISSKSWVTFIANTYRSHQLTPAWDLLSDTALVLRKFDTLVGVRWVSISVKSQLPTELILNSKHSVKMPTLLLSVKITLSGVDGIGHRGKSWN